ncbi:YihY/virulence factor BrkB family protein [Cellulomonas rhizosphaerae]|uniref:YihY/virulence factor BrkB family protein n=1 Tax=Cellulomonas rhizosphaerae TaxID=2293719 RepID=A0A413RKI1_9CELL|nr:YihY/virulence factor BrkB family protein [Cellulomonas rhizosphaerae]RHA39653.1 YihY/virulence factor BrkB family protein [Cellulomonas rhizosphaerae]
MSEPVGAGRAHAAAPADDSTPPSGTSLVGRAKALLAWWNATRPARANARFGERGGGVLTGGIAYAALFSVFAALTIGYTIFMAVLGNNEKLRQSVLDAINDNLPGLIDTGSNQGMIDPESLKLSGGLTTTGIIAVVVLLLSALSATAALRTGVRAMFAEEGGGNAITGKLRQLGGLAGLAFAVLLAAILTTAVGSAAQWLLSALGWGDASGVTLRIVGILVALVIDAATFVLIVRLLAGENPPRRDLLWGAVIAGVGIGVVRFLGTTVVAGSVGKNPLFTSVAVIVTLLIWVNLISRIVLLASAWVANPQAPAKD